MMLGRSALLAAANAEGASDPYFANVSLLLRGAGSGSQVLDESPRPKTITAVGNAGISTTVFKYGSSSLAFDGSGDWLTIPNTTEFDQVGDFTHECWYYRVGSGDGTLDQIFFKNITNYLYLAVDRSNYSRVVVNQAHVGNIIIGTTQTQINTWYHLAVSRSSGDVRLFVNGVQEGSTVANSNNVSGFALQYIGGFTSPHGLNGYIDDLRITRNFARYTSNFTPPPAELPNF